MVFQAQVLMRVHYHYFIVKPAHLILPFIPCHLIS